MAFRGNPLLGYWHRMSTNPTAPEAALEPAIAALGERYRFQDPRFMNIKYFPDYTLLDRKLIIEIDGTSHDDPAQKEKDLQHTLQVLALGWKVARITNEQALRCPEAAVDVALQWARTHDIDWLTEVATAALARLHRDYPHLLAAAATKSKRRQQSALRGAALRSKRAAPDRARKLKLRQEAKAALQKAQAQANQAEQALGPKT